jgi:hypothetical protein
MKMALARHSQQWTVSKYSAYSVNTLARSLQHFCSHQMLVKPVILDNFVRYEGVTGSRWSKVVSQWWRWFLRRMARSVFSH